MAVGIALLDLGMVGHTTPPTQEHLLKVLVAVSEGKGEEAADVVVRMSENPSLSTRGDSCRQIGQMVASSRNQGLQELNGRHNRSLNVSRHAMENGLFVPTELTLLGKTLLQLDEVGRIWIPPSIPMPPSAATPERSRPGAWSGTRRWGECSVP